MRKRLVALLLAIVVVICAMAVTAANGGICFVGINDSVPQYLSAAEAPYHKGGILYIPYTVFQTGPGGVAVSYNADKGSLALFTRAKRLVYDLEAGTVTDEAERVGKVEVAYKNGVLFVPATKALSHFGLTYTMLTSASGSPVLRITDGSQKLDNNTFIRKAETLISIILEQEQTSDEGSEQETQQRQEEPKHTGPVTVYPVFAGEAVSDQTLSLLKDMSVHAVFFVTKEQIRQDSELIRRIYVSGHRIGLTVQAEEPNIQQALEETNQALDHILFFKTLLVLLPPGAPELPQYAVFRDNGGQPALDDLLNDGKQPHLLIYRTDPSFALQRLQQEGAYMPMLLETTYIPGVSAK